MTHAATELYNARGRQITPACPPIRPATHPHVVKFVHLVSLSGVCQLSIKQCRNNSVTWSDGWRPGQVSVRLKEAFQNAFQRRVSGTDGQGSVLAGQFIKVVSSRSIRPYRPSWPNQAQVPALSRDFVPTSPFPAASPSKSQLCSSCRIRCSRPRAQSCD